MINIFTHFCSALVKNIIADIDNNNIKWEYNGNRGSFYKTEMFINITYNYEIYLYSGTHVYTEIISLINRGRVKLGLYDRIILNRYLKKLLSTVLLNKNKK